MQMHSCRPCEYYSILTHKIFCQSSVKVILMLTLPYMTLPDSYINTHGILLAAQTKTKFWLGYTQAIRKTEDYVKHSTL